MFFMKYLYLTFLVIFTCIPKSYADNVISYSIGTGVSFIRVGADEINPHNQMINFAIRYYKNDNIFYSANLTTWNDGSNNEFSENGTVLTGNVGYRTDGLFFFETSLGVGYLNNPDGNIITVDDVKIEQGYTSGHRQFEINIGSGYKIGKNTAILFGWTHFSNCATICRLDSSYKPNGGRDFLRLNIETRF